MSISAKRLWALAMAMRSRPGWRLDGSTLAATWTVETWRVEVLVSLFFGDDLPKGPSTVFSVFVTPERPGTRWRARLGRSAWHQALVASLGARYEMRDDTNASWVLRSADLRKVVRELDRVAAILGSDAGTTMRGRPTLDSVCESIATSAGPWQLQSLSYRYQRRARVRRTGTAWILWKALSASTRYEVAEGRIHPGVLAMFGVTPDDWTPETRRGSRPAFPKTASELLRAGYKAMHDDDDRAATFLRLEEGLARRFAMREIDRLERLQLT